MAIIRSTATKLPAAINTFLGLNEDTSGETQLKLGESPYMINWKITDSYKLKKRSGYKSLFALLNKPIRGMWYGKLNGTYHFLFACNGNIYEHNLTTHTNTSIGTLTDDKTFFFNFNDKVYILNGYEYKKWDGTTFATVTGYRPLIAIGSPPTGGGTPFEEINLLTGAKHQTFSPTAEKPTAYQLADTNITSVDFVRVNGVNKTVTTDYTVDLANGKVTFVSTTDHDSNVPDSIDIGWTKGTGNRSLVEKCKKALLYGGSNDTRVFIWGNSDCKNRRIYTGLASGVPSAEYFPANSFSDVGSDEFAITDITRQYDRQIVFKENETYYSSIEITADGVQFPIYPLNSEKGSVTPVQTILNNPFSVHEGVYQWIATTVRDERNATYMSKRVQSSLDEVDLSKAITFDYEDKGEYWLCVDNTVWIYNYRNDTWYKYVLYDTPTTLIVIDGVLYFGTNNGTIMQFDDSTKTDNGNLITSEWQMGFYNWDADYLNKYLSKTWISIKPDIKSSVKVFWETNKDDSLTSPVETGYNNLDYQQIDYNDWTYNTTYKPMPFMLKTKAKKFVYFKLILVNDSLIDTTIILSIDLLGRLGGQAK